MQAQDELYRIFLAVSGGTAPDSTAVRFALADLIAQLGEDQRGTVAQTAATQSKSTAQSQGRNSASTSQGQKSESTFERVLKSGFGVSPIVSGLFDLFTGSEEPAPLPKYVLPRSIAFQAAETRDGLTTADFDQGGAARAYGRGTRAGESYSRTTAGESAAAGDWTAPGDRPSPKAGESAGRAAATQTTQQITVNVSAMDARSFLDRSGDIAAAVREAMLNLNSINDVVNEL